MSALEFLDERLREIRLAGLYREMDGGSRRAEVEQNAHSLGMAMIDASSNNYLNYGTEVSRETARGDVSWGSGASRLIHGTRIEHSRLEDALASWVRQARALLFTSGYAANIGTLSALVQRDDVIISDAYNHASIVDGCRLSAAQIEITPHCRFDAVATALSKFAGQRRCWVVLESYYSMDGDSPNLTEIRSICDEYNAAMIVDEAHALGVFGPEGSGLCRQYGVMPDVLVGTFGKSLAAQGAFVATALSAIEWIWNRARSFVYSTAISPQLAAAVMRRLALLRADDRGRHTLHRNASLLRELLAEAHVPVVPQSHGPIVPIILEDARRAQLVAYKLGERGILAQAIRPPTVPNGMCRIRLTLHSGIDESQIHSLALAVRDACQL